MAKNTQVSDNLLRYGDYITLRNSRLSSYLSCEGILNNDVFLSENMSSFEDHIFQVVMQRQYSAKSEYEEFLAKRQALGGAMSTDDASRKHFDALSRGKTNEIVMNDLLMKHKIGCVVRFGDVIQLMHVKSKKFLFVPGKDLARDERENMLLTLNEEGGMNSWINLLPRFKINKEGDSVANNTECVLRVAERGLEHLHCSDRSPSGVFRQREVNASMEVQSPWRLSIYQSTQFPVGSGTLMLGELVCIRDPEVSSNLQPFITPMQLDTLKIVSEIDSVQESLDSAAKEKEDGDEEGDGEGGSDDVSITSAQEFQHEYGSVTLKPSSENLDSNSIWVMESQAVVRGGALLWYSDLVYLRHLNTGAYLTSYDPSKHSHDEVDQLLDVEQDGEIMESCFFATTKHPTPPRALFSISALHASGENMTSSEAMQLQQGGMYLERSPVYHDRWQTYPCAGTRNKMRAAGLIINKYVEDDGIGGDKVNPRLQACATDIHFGLSIMYLLKNYLGHAVIPGPRDTTSTSIWPGLDEQERAYFGGSIDKILLFIRGYPIVLDSLGRLDYKINPLVCLRRQNIFRDQGSLEYLVRLLSLLIPISDRLTSNNAAPSQFADGGLLQSAKSTISDCLKILHEVSTGNKVNQLYIAEFMPVVLAHCGSDPLAARITQDLLSSNRELQETRITAMDITSFSVKIKEVGMASMFLRLLQSCCANTTASGTQEGIPKNQTNVLDILFKQHSDALISLRANMDDMRFTSWLGSSDSVQMFVPTDVQEPDVKGAAMYLSGLPFVQLTWQTKITELNPVNMFSKQNVRLIDVFKDELSSTDNRMSFLDSMKRSASIISNPESSSMRTSSKESSTDINRDRRKQVGDFLVAQIYLAAHLCIGRNFTVLSVLEAIYPYGLLIALLKDNNSPPALQGAAACLLTNLYVDRDPQISVSLPRLTRTWSEICNEDSSSIFSIDAARINMFMLPQLIIASHIGSLKDRPFTPATHSILLMLRKLVVFGFYGDRDKLFTLIESLLAALKRDSVTVDGANDRDEKPVDLDQLSGASSLSVKSKQKAVLSRRMASYKVGAEANDSDDGDVEMSALLSPDKSDLGMDIETLNERWELRLLRLLESVAAMYLMVLIVALAVGEAIWSYAHISNNSLPEGIYAFEYIVFCIFAFDVTARAYCHKIVRGPLLHFVTDIFNIFDIGVVILDIIIFAGQAVGEAGGGTGIGKVLRVVRVLRVLRAARFLKILIVYRAMRIINAAAEMISGSELLAVKWDEPERFSKTSESNIQNLVDMCTILGDIQALVEDRNMSLLLHGFHHWNIKLGQFNGDKDKEGPNAAAYLSELEGEFTTLRVSSHEWDDIYIDLLMYSSPELVQSALNVLMSHHLNKRTILYNCSRIQLLSNQRRETQYLRLESLIKSLNGYFDTFEVWCTLKTDDSKKINVFVHDALVEVATSCHRRREILRVDEDFEPDEMVQDILRNLRCFDLCIRIMKLHSTIDVNNTIAHQHTNTRQLILEASRIIYWMTLDNNKAQNLAYGHFAFFVKFIDEKVESHRIIAAIFRDNEFLAKSVPKQYISDFINMIINSGRFPQYLSFLTAIAVVGGKNLIENQYEIIRLLSAPYNQKKCVLYFVPTSHPTYAKKIKDMAPFMARKDAVPADLSSDLAYHLDLIQLLGRCTVGRDGMTTIEAKVQSMYSFVDLIESILDPNCLPLAKVRYGQFLYSAMLEVEMRLPSLKDAKVMWDLLESMQDAVAFAKDEVRQIEKNGWAAPTSNRQKLEYMLVCASVVSGYFQFYFDYSVFRPEMGQVPGVERVQIREKRVWELVTSLFYKFRAIYEMQTPLLTKEQQISLYEVLEVLNNIPPSKIVMKVEPLHESFQVAAVSHSAQEKALEQFLGQLMQDESVQASVADEAQEFIAKIEGLPRIGDVCDAEVRLEPLVGKLVAHIRGTIQVVTYGGEVTKYIDEQATRTNTWLIRNFRLMIENRWGMTIFERDDDGGEEQDDAARDIMKILNESGATEACLELIARGIKSELQAEAIKLLVALLFQEGGAHAVQVSIHNCLSRRGSHLFFAHMRNLLQTLISWHKWHGIVILEEGAEPELPDEIILVRMLQLLCEGHFLPNQDILREQPNNIISINLLDDFVQYLTVLDPIPCRTSTTAALAVSATILEVIQGPCERNQDHFALTSELLETLNRKLRQRVLNDCVEDEELELKKTLIDILQGLLEGQGRRLAVYERVLSVIHLDVVRLMIKAEPDVEVTENMQGLMTECLVLLQLLLDFRPSLKEEMEIGDEELSEGMNVVSIEVVWRGELQRRFFAVPEICSDLAKSTKDAFIHNADRSSNEGKLFDLISAGRSMYTEILHQQVLKGLGLAGVFSRTTLVYTSWVSLALACIVNALFIAYYQNVVVECQGNNSAAFNSTAPTFEPTSYPTSIPTSIPTSAPTSPGLSAGGDSAGAPGAGDDGGEMYIAPCLKQVLTNAADGTDISKVALAIGILLVLSSAYGVINCFVVRTPVVFASAMIKTDSLFRSALVAATDGVTMYQSIYLALAIASLWQTNHHIASILLLDVISKSQTAQATLMALWKPKKTIALAMLLTFIFCYVFAIFFFYFLNNDGGLKHEQNAVTLRNTFLMVLRYGSPTGSNSRDMIVNEGITTYRWIWDFCFFMMCFTMWNVIKGITIDTFVELRTDLTARMDDTTEKCFMCGIDRLTFNKALDREAFGRHIQREQNLWNYVFYCIFIWEQDRDDDDGLEYYIRHCLERGDLTWFPMNKAIRLMEHLERGEATSLQYLFKEDLKGVEGNFDDQVTTFKDELGKFITKVENTLMYVPEPSRRREKSRGYTGFGTPGETVHSNRGDHSDHSHSPIHTPGGAQRIDDGQNEFRWIQISVCSVDGLVVPPDVCDRVSYRLVTDYDTVLQQGIRVDSSEQGDGKVKISFDAADRGHAIHEGRIAPDSTLSARIQLLYKATHITGIDGNDAFMFLGAADISFDTLLCAAVAAFVPGTEASINGHTATLEVALPQKAFLLPDQVNHCIVALKVAVGSVLLTETMSIGQGYGGAFPSIGGSIGAAGSLDGHSHFEP